MTLHVRRRFFPAMAVSLALGVLAQARGQDSGATAPVSALYTGLLAIMKAGRATPFNQRMQMIIPVVQQVFDLPAVLQASVGLRWTSFTPEQQQTLLQAFTAYTAANYVANFDTFNGQRFDVSPAVRRAAADTIVSSTFIGSDGKSTRFDYVVRQVGGGYKVVDVLLDGSISRVAVQRSDFRAVLTSNDPAALITLLRNKVSNLAAGGGS